MRWLDLPILIPTPPRFGVVVPLSETNYLLEFDWFERDRSWRLYVSRTSGEPVVRTRLSVNCDLLRTVATRYKPPGRLVAVSPDDTPAGRYDLGSRVPLKYGDPNG